MLDVLIDSCIYRADRKRSKSSFRIIARLARAGKLRVHVPTYVKNEVISQQQEDVGKHIGELKSTAEGILRITGAAILTKFSQDIWPGWLRSKGMRKNASRPNSRSGCKKCRRLKP